MIWDKFLSIEKFDYVDYKQNIFLSAYTGCLRHIDKVRYTDIIFIEI